MAEQRQTYTAEFTRDAVRLVTEHHYGMAEAARHLGIKTNMRRRWSRKHSTASVPKIRGCGWSARS
jgi:transposase-like protein